MHRTLKQKSLSQPERNVPVIFWRGVMHECRKHLHSDYCHFHWNSTGNERWEAERPHEWMQLRLRWSARIGGEMEDGAEGEAPWKLNVRHMWDVFVLTVTEVREIWTAAFHPWRIDTDGRPEHSVDMFGCSVILQQKLQLFWWQMTKVMHIVVWLILISPGFLQSCERMCWLF